MKEKETKENTLEKIILALDLSNEGEVRKLLSQLKPKPKTIKIGLQAVLGIGLKNLLELLKEFSPESELFLDLKLHDIPNTVSSGIKSLFSSVFLENSYNLKFLTLHSLGGFKMLSDSQRLIEELSQAGHKQAKKTNLVGVTLLTSHDLDDLRLLFGIKEKRETDQYIHKLIGFSQQAGLKYFVCSALEANSIKKQFPEIKLICPGVRISEQKSSFKEDQSRLVQIEEALKIADLIVIGRPIYKAKEPQESW